LFKSKGEFILKKNRYISVFSLILVILSVYFCSKFQAMAYWGSGLTWFWIEVSCVYICAITAIGLVFVKKKGIELSLTDKKIRVLSFTIAVLNILWTTFAIIAGFSGM
jgi:hypothetical protein